MLDNRIKSENRIALWDNMKFVLIFLVVLCHIADWSLLHKRVASTALFCYNYISMVNSERTDTKTSIKRIIICIAGFLLLAALIFAYLNKVFSMGDSDSNRQIFKAFYAEKKNTVDVAYVGTSASNRYFIDPKAYHDEGITAFTVATMGMPMFFVPEIVDEIEKRQDPKLYIFELRWFDKNREQITDAHIRRVTDNLQPSMNKLTAIDKAMTFMDGSTGALGDITYSKADYLFPIIKYHGRLMQGTLERGDWKLTSTRNRTKGYVMSYSTTKQVKQSPGKISEKRGEMSEEARQVLNELLDFCDGMDKDKEILFVLSPYSVKEESMPRLNTAIDIVKKRGYDVINFNTAGMYSRLGLDWDKDFYNSKHVNYIGAEKYTDWLTSYISRKYRLEDHRGDPAYESWDEAYRTYTEYIEENDHNGDR